MAEPAVSPAGWEVAPAEPGIADPAALGAHQLAWCPARVPGTVAGALAAAGRWRPEDPLDTDGQDWWWRATVDVPGAGDGWALHVDGLATVADVFWNGDPVLHVEGMFRSHRVDPIDARPRNELVVCCRALSPRLAARRPRPRWRTRIVEHHQLRWFRTTLLGRMPSWSPGPPPVGPWRPLRLVRGHGGQLLDRWLHARADGSVDVRARLREPLRGPVQLRCGGAVSEVDPVPDGDDLVVSGRVAVPGAERWWPAGMGGQPLYDVVVAHGGDEVALGRVGFRTVEVDRSGGGFRVVVNGVPVFCRGAVWTPLDPIGLDAPPAEVRRALTRLRDAGATMVRVPGTMVYEPDHWWDACDELGLLVWQDAMLANLDPPDTDEHPDFAAELEAEWTQLLRRLQGRPSLAVLCGGSEIEQQAAMLGLPPDRRRMPAIDELLPAVARREAPGVPWVANSPTGAGLPFHPGDGVAHYYGVGAYLRPLDDARRAHVRFAAECLAFANPPDERSVEELFGGAAGAGHEPRWKAGVPRDRGAGWDFEDVRDHYVAERFGVDPARLRYADPARYLDLGRAVTHDLVHAVLTEWRRPGSSCGGGLVLMARDLVPGPGWGLVDVLGRPKSAWFGLAAASAPVALLATDEGLNGWHLHVVNDRPDGFAGRLVLETFARGHQRLERAEVAVDVPPRGATTIVADGMLEGFRDLTWAYRFGPVAQDVVSATLLDAHGAPAGWATLLPLGPARPVESCVGLQAVTAPDAGDEGGWVLTVETARFAQHVVVDVPGYWPSASWFHLAPGHRREVALTPVGPATSAPPRGEVRALNSAARARVGAA